MTHLMNCLKRLRISQQCQSQLMRWPKSLLLQKWLQSLLIGLKEWVFIQCLYENILTYFFYAKTLKCLMKFKPMCSIGQWRDYFLWIKRGETHEKGSPTRTDFSFLSLLSHKIPLNILSFVDPIGFYLSTKSWVTAVCSFFIIVSSLILHGVFSTICITPYFYWHINDIML